MKKTPIINNQPIKWGILGGGEMVGKSGAIFNRIPGSKLQAVCRRNISDAKETVKLLNAESAYSSIEKFLKDPNIDAVYIATPPGLHLEQALLCCAAKKPTYIAKPMARNYSESLELVEAFEKSNVPLFVGHYRRALPHFQKLKEVLDDGIIGKPIEIDFRMCRRYPANKRKGAQDWIYNPKLSGGGKFFDISPHTIDILIYLFGDIVDISSRVINSTITPAVEDVVSFVFNTSSGAVGTANFNMASSQKSDQLIIAGTKGHIIASIHGSEPILVSGNNGESKIDIPLPDFKEEPMIANTVQSLLGNEESQSLSRDALPTMKVIDTILDEYYKGRSDDFWLRPDTWSRGD